jgi:DNA-binding CsgD family transcriptional regulator
MKTPKSLLEPAADPLNISDEVLVMAPHNSPFIVYISEIEDLHDLSSEKIVWANRRMQDYAGSQLWQPGTIAGVPAEALRHPEESAAAKIIGRLFSHSDHSVPLCSFMRLKDANGVYKWFFMHTYVIEYTNDHKAGRFLNTGIETEMQPEDEGSLNNLLRHLRRRKHSKRIAIISEREHQILQLVIEGLTDKEIADRLYISPRTAQTHRNRLLKKTGTLNTASLVAFAYECGLR